MNEPIKKITLDFTGCNRYQDMHDRMKKTLDFPDHYGNNLSALWDSLSADTEYAYNTFVTIKGINTMPASLQEHMKKALAIFDKNKTYQQKWNQYFDYEVVDAD